MGAAGFDRDGDDLHARGLFLDMPAWGYHVFEVTAVEGRQSEYECRCAAVCDASHDLG
jgi:hypothetical protein